jgi:putative phage-type endonuclease
LQLHEAGIIDIPPANRKIGKGCYPYKPIKQYLREKCVAYGEQQPFTGNMYTWHGTKYEDAAAVVYEYKNNQVVHDFGLIRHPIYSFLGASPDGITSSGRMLEIKVPLSRKLSGIPPIHYWIQMQLQMECCNFDVCDFVECKISEYDTEDQYLSDTFVDEQGNSIYGLTKEGMYKGCMLCVEYIDGDNTRKQMIYSPLANQMKNHDEMIEWTKAELLKLVQGNNGNNLIEIILQEGCMSVERFWWKMDQYSQVEVERDPVWFEKRLFDFEEFWKNVEKYRVEGIPESCMPKKKNGQLVDDDEDETPKKTQSTLSFKNTSSPFITANSTTTAPTTSTNSYNTNQKQPLKKGQMGFCIVDDDDDF